MLFYGLSSRLGEGTLENQNGEGPTTDVTLDAPE